MRQEWSGINGFRIDCVYLCSGNYGGFDKSGDFGKSVESGYFGGLHPLNLAILMNLVNMGYFDSGKSGGSDNFYFSDDCGDSASVSYTHLTLPTNREV